MACKFRVVTWYYTIHKVKMAAYEEACTNEIDVVLEPSHADILESEEEFKHAFGKAIEKE